MTGIYVHIPFCDSKCGYCNFVSIVGGDKKAYIMALCEEIKIMDAFHNESANSVFFGGGTPSTLSPVYLELVLNALKKSMHICKDAEITLEANPGTVDMEKLKAYKRLGINRLSFGLQSADDKELETLGRIHTYDEFLTSYQMARKVGFNNINIDLIFGLPDQTKDKFLSTIKTVSELKPEHISAYALKLEKGTPMYRDYKSSLHMPGEKTERDMYHAAIDFLQEKGYVLYETSNFALSGYECKHNLKYWTGDNYIGYGVAAHGYYVKNGTAIRTANTSDIQKYIDDAKDGIHNAQERIVLTKKDIEDEYVMLRLRLKTGIDFADFETHFSYSFKEKYAKQIEKLVSNKLLTRDNTGIYPTIKGFDLQNTLISEFL